MRRSTRLIIIGVLSILVGVIVVQTIDSALGSFLERSEANDRIAYFLVSSFGSLLQYGLAPFGGCLVALGIADRIPRTPSQETRDYKSDQSLR